MESPAERLASGDPAAKGLERLIERVARQVVRRELAPVAVFTLEAGKPFARVGSQLLIFLMPIARYVLPDPRDYDRFVELLDDRDQLERLICRIEALDDERLAGPHRLGG